MFIFERIWLAFCILLLIALPGPLYSRQANDDQVKNQITNILMQMDSSSELLWLHSMRSLLPFSSSEQQFSDPYHSLKDCYIFSDDFSIRGNREAQIGIFKNSSIIWNSPAVIQNATGDIYSIQDLNRDGMVDIATRWKSGATGEWEQLWIISWDGTSGHFINAYDQDGSSHITAQAGSFYLDDLDGDGIKEIVGNNAGNHIVFRWNGANYDTSDVTLPVDNMRFGIANNVSVSIKATAYRTGTSFSYVYSVTNQKNSKNVLTDIFVSSQLDSIQGITPAGWMFATQREESLARFSSQPSGVGLTIGKKDSGFTIVSTRLPAIRLYYAQGEHSVPLRDPAEIPNHIQDYIHDIFNNSVNGFTIAPNQDIGNISSPAICDTLISYTNQSLALGWLAQKKDLDISDGESNKDSIATNLIKRLQAIKSTLQQGDSISARTLLQKFVDKVEAEHVRSVNRMSDECYALLKYNGEYLKDKLPSQ